MKIENVIHIEAPIEVVWAVTEDIERWPEWTPTMNSIKRISQGEFGIGSTALVKQPALPETQWTVTVFKPNEQFTWEGQMMPGMRTVATHEMVATESGTQSLLWVEMSGFMARLLWPFIRSSVQQALEQENAGLKGRCEASIS